MKHRGITAGFVLACVCATAPAGASDRNWGKSFEDHLREQAEERLSFIWNSKRDDDWRQGWGHVKERLRDRLDEHFEDRGDRGWRDHDWSRHGWQAWHGGNGFGHGWHDRPWLDPHCVTPVPEPASALLMAGGLLTLVWTRRRRR